MIANIIVPIDGSQPSLHALNHAAHLAQLAKAKLHLLHVTLPGPLELMNSMGYPGIAQRQAEASAASFEEARAQGAREIIDAARRQLPSDITAIERIIPGPPADTILDYASEYDDALIVMGSRGLSEPQEWFMGSVSSKVVQQAECPVTIVH